MIELRDYQKESITELRQNFRDHTRQVLCLPTGAGKTVVFSEMVRMAAEKGTITLVLTDRIELFKQTFKSLSRHGIHIQELNAQTKGFDPSAVVTLAMVETFKRRAVEMYSPQLIIIDEAHKGNFTKILDKYPNSRVVGATATPVGKHFYKYYTNIVQNVDIPDLLAEGFLVDCKAYQMQDDFSDLEVKRGEYTESSQFMHFNKRKLYTGVIDNWKKYAEGKKTIVFNVNIEHSEQMTQEFNDAGILSECITSKTPKDERRRILKAFSAGLIPVLNNCGILTTGYDEPSIECVIMNRKTKSLPLFLQCCGRGSRLYPGKENFIVLDFGENHNEHGMWEEPRNWELKKPRKKKDGAAPVKMCPTCDAMLHASLMVCKYCGHIFQKKEEKVPEGKMVEVVPQTPDFLRGRKISDLDMDELIKLQQSKKYKASFIWRVIRSRGEQYLIDYAAKMGYKPSWVRWQKGHMSDCQFKNYILK